MDRRANGWARATALLLGIYSLLFVFLVFAIYQEDKRINVALVILAVAGLSLAAAILMIQRRWLLPLAVALALVDLAGDAPVQIQGMLHPVNPGRTVVESIIVLVGVATLVIAVVASFKSRRPEFARHHT